MAGNRKGSRFDSHQVIGVLVICGVIAAMVGFALQRLDVVLMAIAGAAVVALLVLPRDRQMYGDGGGTGNYDGGDDGGCGD